MLAENIMAVWQWDVWIVPKQEVAEHFSSVPQYMQIDWFESINWWNFVSKSKLIDFFNNVLPNYYTPWAKDTQSWGSDDGDRAELMIENDVITDVVIRVDLRNLNVDFLQSLINFCEKSEFLFFSLESGRFIEPDFDKLISEIKSSRKMIFVQDPKRFFEDKNYLNKINKENLRKIDEEN